MKPRKPIRRTPLKRPTLEQVHAWDRKPRKRIARVGRKAKRESADRLRFAESVFVRANGWCEAGRVIGRGNPAAWATFRVCGTEQPHAGEHAHHVWPEDRDAGRHDPERGIWLCSTAHRWVHDHPAQAARYGLLRPTA